MAVTLSENEKKALSELFTSIQDKKNLFGKKKDMMKNIKKSFKIFLKFKKSLIN